MTMTHERAMESIGKLFKDSGDILTQHSSGRVYFGYWLGGDEAEFLVMGTGMTLEEANSSMWRDYIAWEKEVLAAFTRDEGAILMEHEHQMHHIYGVAGRPCDAVTLMREFLLDFKRLNG